jgi:hypothetical protein
MYGIYSTGFTKKIVLAHIGERESQCYGRCGSQCGDETQSKDKYTAECLSHDLCHRIEGTQLGECSDEFKNAAVSAITARVCPKH